MGSYHKAQCLFSLEVLFYRPVVHLRVRIDTNVHM